MPQFDPTYFISQLIWLLVFFSMLYVCVRYYFVPRARKAMVIREKERRSLSLRIKSLEEMVEKLSLDIKGELKRAEADSYQSMLEELESIEATWKKKYTAFCAEEEEKLADFMQETHSDGAMLQALEKAEKEFMNSFCGQYGLSYKDEVVENLYGR